jgi:hypothetical protein
MVRSRTSRLSSVLALVACLSAQLAGAVHSASVRHVACSEHGGVVELHADADTPAVLQRDADTLRAARTESHHAHCELCATFSAVPHHHTPIASAHAPSFALPVPARSAPRFPYALFLLAPKGSPPRFAAI